MSKKNLFTFKSSIFHLFLILFFSGCSSPQKYREQADRVASEIISQKQQEALGKTGPFFIETPAETLRKKLLLSHDLPYSSSASLGTKFLKPIKFWPKDSYLETSSEAYNATAHWFTGKPIQVKLLDTLQIGARNSRDYQSRKEDIFIAALDLDLERDDFRSTFTGLLEGFISTHQDLDPTLTGAVGSAEADLSKQFQNGVGITSGIALDLVKLLDNEHTENMGVFADATISIPLLRGAGRHIVSEPLTQANRNVIYVIYEFERFKRTFAVRIASEYLGVLRELNQVRNVEENYRGLIASARRARRLADAGRLPEFQFDQAVQDEYRARSRWIQGQQTYARRLDEFKITLGLPPDAKIELDPQELNRLQNILSDLLSSSEGMARYQNVPPADAEIHLDEPGKGDPGPLEMYESEALLLALANRLDLRIEQGRVYDAQRAVMIAADDLRAELTLFGSAQTGDRRSVTSGDPKDAQLNLEEGFYSGLLTLDLPFERTAERNRYRESYIFLERAVRNFQNMEDRVKLEIRNGLRNLLEFREGIQIQAQAVLLAEKRVKSTNLFLQAGRAQIRDLLDSQEDLLSAQNSMNSAVVNYRIAELSLQRDLGLLEVNEEGLWTEIVQKGDK